MTNAIKNIWRHLTLLMFLLIACFNTSAYSAETEKQTGQFDAKAMATRAARAIYHYDQEQLLDIMKGELQVHDEIKGLKISDVISGEALLTYFRKADGTVYGEAIPDEIRALDHLTQKVMFNDEVVATIEIYCHLPKTILLTDEEKNWLSSNSKWKVANEVDWPPFDFAIGGKPQGFSIDIVKLAADKVGAELEFVNGYTWAQLMEQFKAGKLDILPALFKTKERQSFIAFTHNYAANPSVMVVHGDDKTIKKLADLQGKSVAVIEGYANEEVLAKDHPGIRRISVKDISAGLNAVSLSKVDAFIASLGAVSYIIEKEFTPNISIVGDSGIFEPRESYIYMGVAKEREVFRNILQKGIDAITVEEYSKIRKRWMPFVGNTSVAKTHINLTRGELRWLGEQGDFTLGVDPSWPPFEFIDQKGIYSGVGAGYVELVAARLGVTMKPLPDLSWVDVIAKAKAGEVDILPAVARTSEREKYLHFTRPYISFPVVIATRKDAPFVDSLKGLGGKRVGVAEGYAMHELLITNHKELDILAVENIAKGLRDLNNGKLDAFVDNIVTITRELERSDFDLLKIAAPTQYKLELAMAVRKGLPELVPLLDKALASINKRERASIVNSWIALKVEYGLDFKTVLLWIVPFILIAVVIIFFVAMWNRKLAKEINIRKMAQKELGESESRLNLALDGGDLGTWELNLATGDMVFDSRSTTILGYTSDEIDHSRSEWIDRIYSDDLERVLSSSNAYAKNETSIFDEEYRMVLKDGSLKWVHSRGNVVARNENGEPIRMAGTIMDITERKRIEAGIKSSEARLRNILENAVDGIITIDEKGIVTSFNQAAQKIFGYDASEVIGNNINMLQPEPIHSEHNGYISRYLQTGHSKIIGAGREVNGVRKNGTQIPLHLSVSVIKIDDKPIFTGFLRDITEQKTQAKNIVAARNKAEKATRIKSEFLANMSHEIRTPMNAIIGFLELVLEDPSLPEHQRKHLTTSRISASSLLALINDILDISKLESGKLTIEKRPFNLSKLMESIHEALNIAVGEKGLDLQFDVHPSLSGSFIGDSLRIRQIIVNLVGNAIKFTEKGSVSMCALPAEEEDQLHFIIEDTGIGISADRLKHIFDPFTQVDSSTTRKFGGTGLGTTISQELVELMGGRIWAESKVGKGSTFHFTIELPSTDQVPEDTDLFIVSGRLGQPGYRVGFRVLLVEDVQANLELAKIRLEQQGHKVMVALNGREAIEAYQKGEFDLILMDIQMPKMGGVEATERIRALEADSGRHVPIIAMTAAVMREETEKYIKSGMNAVVAKPVDFNKLFKTMEAVIPEGVGMTVSKDDAAVTTQPGLGLPPLNGIDIEKGIQTWQDSEAYTKALLGFSRDYGSAAAELARLIDEGDVEGAYTLAHKLKGVAGNLSVVEVADVAVSIDAALYKKRIEDAKNKLPTIDAALKTAIDAIGQLKGIEEGEETPKKEIDTTHLKELFVNVLPAFNEFSPYAIEPFLSELKKYLTQDQLNPIADHIERFDFEGAKAKTIQLAETLKINLEE